MIKSPTTRSPTSIDEIYNVLKSLNRKIVKQKLANYGIVDEEYSNLLNESNGLIENIRRS
jgi:hypothetical protein